MAASPPAGIAAPGLFVPIWEFVRAFSMVALQVHFAWLPVAGSFVPESCRSRAWRRIGDAECSGSFSMVRGGGHGCAPGI
jgi:hypothetical protein